jgi:hypothetical protein
VGVAPGKTQLPSQPHQAACCGCPSSSSCTSAGSRQQPAVGVTAGSACRPPPVQHNYWPLAACEPEPAASGRRAWSRTSGAKRSRVSTPVQWTAAPFVETAAWPVCVNNNNNNNNKDCGMCKVCQDSSAGWNNFYCRAEDRVLWNNENMLRLFQV